MRFGLSGDGKDAAEIDAALTAGIRMINVESRAEPRRVDAVAGGRGVVAPVAFRSNPDVDSETHPYISTGLRTSKFGIPIGEAVEEAAQGLAPNDSTEKFADAVAAWRDDAMLVGHLPHMERLTAHLVTGDAAAAITTFSAGTVVCLERFGDHWVIAWMAGPELLGE